MVDMPFLFTCPHCQTKTQVEDRYSGQAGECVTCGGAIQLPDFLLVHPQRPASPAKDTKRIGWMIAAVVSVILLGCLLFAMVRVGGDTMTQLTDQPRTHVIDPQSRTNRRSIERLRGRSWHVSAQCDAGCEQRKLAFVACLDLALSGGRRFVQQV